VTESNGASDGYPVSDLPTPDPSYGPGDAIGIQLDALGSNDEPRHDAGIMTAYNFASPANRRATGPLERFTTMVRSHRYRPLIDFDDEATGPVERDGNYATQRVTVTGHGGRTVTYEFAVSLQASARFHGCWQTDGVRVVGPAESSRNDPF
jgi:hypothetical protein